MVVCSVCNKNFIGFRQLNGHKSIHRAAGRYSRPRRRKPFRSCDHCGKQTDNPKFCSNRCQQDFHWSAWRIRIASGEILCLLKMQRYVREMQPNCVLCGQGNVWNGKSLVLQIDHIDGNSDNNNLLNLRAVCPNCHTQTETWCCRTPKNSKRQRYARQRRYKIRGHGPDGTATGLHPVTDGVRFSDDPPN